MISVFNRPLAAADLGRQAFELRVCVLVIRFGLAAAALFLWPVAQAQVPLELRAPLQEIGRVVNLQAVAALYAPRVLEREPYRNVKIERDLRYGAAERNVLDVFSAASISAKPKPVLIFIHGGGFVSGNRRLSLISPFYDNVMLWAVRHGMVGVNISYRLAPQNPWPAGIEDLARAISWVTSNITARDGDAAQIFVLGHSSGASHVAGYLSHPEFQTIPGSGLAGALLLSGTYQINVDLVDRSPNLIDYYGFDETLYEQRSSMPGLAAATVPVWLATAELDPDDFVQQADDLENAMCDAGHCPARERFAAHSHMSEVFSIHTDDGSVSDSMLKFIRAH